MKRTTQLLAAAAIGLIASPALATNGMRMTGFGPVQDGMGGVGVAATLDSSAMMSNPAGISDVGRRLDVSGTLFVPTVSFSAAGAGSGKTEDSTRGASVIPNLGVVVPVGGGVTLGLGAFGSSGMGVDYPADLYGSTLSTSFQELVLTPTVAWKPCAHLSSGLALDVAWGQMSYAAASAMGQVPHDTANSLGLGATVGVKFTPIEPLSFGVSYQTRTWFKDYAFSVGPHTVQIPGVGSAPVPGGTDELAFDQPAVLSGGVAWRAVPSLLLAADVEWIQWSETVGASQPRYVNNTNLTGAMPFDMNWSDQVVVKLGLEWSVVPAWKIRLGYDYGKMPLDASRAFENIAFPALAEHHFSGGLGWEVTDALAINASVTWAPKATLSGANASQGISSYTTSMSQVQADLGLAWKF